MVYENIKSAIVSGEIEAGTRLTETKVSEQLNVSTTPVREAFRRLSSEGLVKIIPWRGAIVQEFSSKEILEVYQCREALEVMAISLAADHIDEEGVLKLYELLKESEQASHSRFFEINTEMHDEIITYSRNETLANLISQIKDVVLHNRNISSYSEERKKEIFFEHSEIVQALEKRDKEFAKAAMKKHIENGYLYISNRLKKEESK